MSQSRDDVDEYEQLQLAIAQDDLQKKWRRPRTGPSPIHGMVEFAIEQHYASTIGELLDQVARVRGHRLFNSLLVILQRPHSKLLLSAREWKRDWGRDVRPGEHPVLIMWPFSPVAFVYDVSQVEGPDGATALPADWANPYTMTNSQDSGYALHWLETNARHDGVRSTDVGRGFAAVECIQMAKPGRTFEVEARDGSVARGTKIPIRYEVSLNDAYTPTERLATLAHDLGHLFCGHLGAAKTDWWPARRPDEMAVREFEAESVARLVFRRVAPEAELPDRLATYFGRTLPEATDEWQHVMNAADRIIDMCQGVSPKRIA